jgi:hypothetical protein
MVDVNPPGREHTLGVAILGIGTYFVLGAALIKENFEVTASP